MWAWFVQNANRWVPCLAFSSALFLLFGWISANAQPPSATGQSTLVSPSPDRPQGCHAYFDNLRHNVSWADAEENVLDVLCGGKKYRGPHAPLVVLTSDFIQALVASNQFDSLGYAGILIDGVHVSGNLQLIKLQINNTVSITNSKFLGTVDLGYSSTTHNLDFTGSSFLNRLCLTGFSSTQSVFLSDSHSSNLSKDSRDCYQTSDTDSYISLNFARIDGIVSIRGVEGLGLSLEELKGWDYRPSPLALASFSELQTLSFSLSTLVG
jgi:hypothetical protein